MDPATLSPPPPRLVGPDGTIEAFGMWAGAVADVNLDQLKLPGLPGPLARLRLKRWQHIAVVHPHAALTFAIVDVGFLRVAWVQGIDRETGEAFEHHAQSPLLPMRIARSLGDDRCSVRFRGGSIEIHNQLDQGRHGIAIGVPARGALPAVHAALEVSATSTPLAVNLPLGRGRSMYSHKVVHPAQGSFELGGRRFECVPSTTFAIFDVHQAHYPRHTWWNWATFVGRAGDQVVGLNLTKNVVTDPSLHENALWLDGELSLLSPARFDLPAEGPWTMGTEDGRVELALQPQGERREDVRALVVRSVFRQKFGAFTGHVGDLVLDEAFGLVEDHDSRW